MDEKTLREEARKDELRSGRTLDASRPPGARQFPCINCGGPLVYMPGSTHLKCPYCATENDIPVDQDESYLEERDFLEALEREENRQGEDNPEAAASDVIKCTYCGAVTTVNERRTSDLCPYCGHPLAIQNLFRSKLNVQALLPFAIDSEKAILIYRKWLGSLWFAPNDFKRRATRGEAMRGVYMPYFTYDAATRTWYTGQRGDVYYITVTMPVRENGRTVMRARQMPKVRWTRVSGNVTVNFDDVLVPASQSLPIPLQDGLKPWQLGHLQPFRQEFLAGFVTETYQTPLKEGFEQAKGRMEPQIRDTINRDIGGDQQRIDSKKTEYSKVTFKHILLPVWLSAYAYSGKTYRVSINAQTGEVSGDRPYSVWKIALAVIAALILLALFFFATSDGNGSAISNYSDFSDY